MPQAQNFIDHDDTSVTSLDAARRPTELADRDLAGNITEASLRLQEAMDRAVLAGLIVEPSFQAVGNRFATVGVSAESHLVKIRIMRRLS